MKTAMPFTRNATLLNLKRAEAGPGTGVPGDELNLVYVDGQHAVSCRRDVAARIRFMAKKTDMDSSSLWIVVIVLLALSAWMYFKR
jgi:hypothetical protein